MDVANLINSNETLKGNDDMKWALLYIVYTAGSGAPQIDHGTLQFESEALCIQATEKLEKATRLSTSPAWIYPQACIRTK